MSSDMKNRLSHSSIKLYSECGEKFRLHYQERLREKTKSGALLFGSAFDAATEAVLKDRNINEKEVFDNVFTTQDINGVGVHLPDSLLVVYAASDYDSDLFTVEDKRFLLAKAQELLGYPGEDIIDLYDQVASRRKQRAYKRFSDNDQKWYNLCNWICLRKKGHLMLDANRKHVLPHITKVISTQQKIELANSEGDTVIGFADLVAQWDGKNEDICLDYKTSAREYAEDAVLTSPQLAIYTSALGLRRAGFLVFKKQILKNRTKVCSKCGHDGSGYRYKTCEASIDIDPSAKVRCGGEWKETLRLEAEVQILIDNVPEQLTKIVTENAEMVNRGIKAGVFIRNLDNCVKVYGKCAYYSLCHKDDKNDLVLVEEKKRD